MTPETPEPPQPDGPGASTDDPGGPRPPRILVSVGDLEDPADWDVIVVENDAIDDATALRIARERTGHLGATVPSLDERDIAEAFSTDTDAEGTEDLGVDAFAPPADVPQRTPARPEAPPPMLDDGFGHLPGLDDEEPATADGDRAPGAPAHPFADTDGAALADDPIGVFDPIDSAADAEGDDAAAEDGAAGEPAADPEPEPALHRELLDDPTDDFFDIGDCEVTPTDADGEDGAPAARWTPPDAGIARRALLDDPADDFFDIGTDSVDQALRDADPTTRIGLGLWGTALDEEEAPPAPVDAPTAAAVGAAHRAASSNDAPEEIEPLEDEPVIDSHFPLGPDDLIGEREPGGATIEVDALDYANVFGPVAGTVANLPEVVPVRTRRAEEAMSLGLHLDDEVDDEYDDDDELIPVTASSGGRRGRRRALAVLAMAGLVMAGVGAANALMGGSDRPEIVVGEDESTTTTQARTRVTSASNTTAPTLAIPLSPVDTAPDGSSTNTTRRPRATTTTKPKTTQTTAASTTTTAAPTTTTTQASTTTTTQPTTTTSACDLPPC